ncbi:LPFR motif small protein [Streptomyces sp. NPDC056669]
MLRALADVFRSVGGAIDTVVTLPFGAVARLFGALRTPPTDTTDTLDA